MDNDTAANVIAAEHGITGISTNTADKPMEVWKALTNAIAFARYATLAKRPNSLWGKLSKRLLLDHLDRLAVQADELELDIIAGPKDAKDQVGQS